MKFASAQRASKVLSKLQLSNPGRWGRIGFGLTFLTACHSPPVSVPSNSSKDADWVPISAVVHETAPQPAGASSASSELDEPGGGDYLPPTPLSVKEKKVLSKLSGICQTGVRGAHPSGSSEQELGCLCCPPFDSCPPTQGRAAENPPHLYPVTDWLDGKFLSADEQQSFVAVEGCGLSSQGGSLALVGGEREGPTSRRRVELLEERSEHLENCLVQPNSDGRDLLICESTTMRQAFGRVAVLVGDLRLPDEDRWESLLSLVDNRLSACMSEQGQPIEIGELMSKRLAVSPSGEPPRLTLRVRTGRGVVDAAYLESCRPWLRSEPEGEKKLQLPDWKESERVFVFNGKTFEPMEKTPIVPKP